MMDKLYLIARIAETRVALRSRAIHSVVAVGTPVEVPALELTDIVIGALDGSRVERAVVRGHDPATLGAAAIERLPVTELLGPR